VIRPSCARSSPTATTSRSSGEDSVGHLWAQILTAGATIDIADLARGAGRIVTDLLGLPTTSHPATTTTRTGRSTTSARHRPRSRRAPLTPGERCSNPYGTAPHQGTGSDALVRGPYQVAVGQYNPAEGQRRATREGRTGWWVERCENRLHAFRMMNRASGSDGFDSADVGRRFVTGIDAGSPGHRAIRPFGCLGDPYRSSLRISGGNRPAQGG
jgi:hypothetical protein